MRQHMAVCAALLLLSACKEQPKPPDTATTTITTTTAPAPAPLAGYVGHFEFWRTTPVTLPQPISTNVKGQFGPLELKLASLNFLATPVRKNAEPFHAEDLHLTAYKLLDPPSFQAHVSVANQFTPNGAEWYLGNPDLLLVPAAKSLVAGAFPPAAPHGPHFLCYTVVKAGSLHLSALLTDQFYKQEVGGLVPKYLCIPVDKHGEGMWNADVHLAVYLFSNGHTFTPAKKVSTTDQFGSHPFGVTTSVMLGVPSKKTVLTSP